MDLLLWFANGLLAALYTLAENLAAVLTVASGLVLQRTLAAAAEFKPYCPWAAATSGLAVLACLVAPTPVPVMMTLLQASGWIALLLEQTDPVGRYWNMIATTGLYAVVGLASLGMAALAADPLNPASTQGAAYLQLGATIALYVIPVGAMWVSLQSIFAHPPMPGRPSALIRAIRTRGKG